jgi:hypothetical protein
MDLGDMARAMGLRGGRTRASLPSSDRRRQIASLGGLARQRSLLAARRLVENLLYAAAVVELQGEAREVQRMKTFAGRLPGLYDRRS